MRRGSDEERDDMPQACAQRVGNAMRIDGESASWQAVILSGIVDRDVDRGVEGVRLGRDGDVCSDKISTQLDQIGCGELNKVWYSSSTIGRRRWLKVVVAVVTDSQLPAQQARRSLRIASRGEAKYILHV